MATSEQVIPFLKQGLPKGSDVEITPTGRFLVTRKIPTEGRPNRMAGEILIEIDRHLTEAIADASDVMLERVIGPRIARLVPVRLADYEELINAPEPYLVILDLPSVGM
ncbi:hypothetical protein LGM58_34200 [Burkholderia contaminans]|uniref:hypothetical protein n=1 Tax=Burkholderia contaminans TaxID=488447 RepID=UPI001CF47041|nr:hypothetical protein [Burkholderia contaminans]MCA7888234.1 hypothetical protein [Burkholderia contaminans]